MISEIENFANYPRSVADIRSDASNRASDWAPRDVLIEMLRKIDGGLKIEALSVAYSWDEGESHFSSYLAAAPTVALGVGVASMALHKMIKDSTE